MKSLFLLAVMIAALGTTAEARAELLAQQQMPAFYEGTGHPHFQGQLVLSDAPSNARFAVAYTDCQASGSALSPACAAQFRELGFYLLHTAYFWDPASGNYLPAASQPEADYQITNANLTYDPVTQTVSYDLEFSYAWTCRGLGCQYAPLIVASLYANLEESTLDVYSDSLSQGNSCYLLTGDGEERYTQVDFSSPNALDGTSAIAVHTERDSGAGTHWKLMLFAHGNAAAYSGIDLSAYSRLELAAKTNRAGGVWLQGAFGTADDSASRGLGAFLVTTEWQHYELDLTGLDLSDVNTLLWVYLHKGLNPFDFSGTDVLIDDVRLVR